MSSGRSGIHLVLLLEIWVSSDVALSLIVSDSISAVSISVLVESPHEVMLSSMSCSVWGL